MTKDKKKILILVAVVFAIIVCVCLIFIFLKDGEKSNEGGNTNNPGEQIVIPDAPAENTENLVQNLEKIEIFKLNNDTIEFSEKLEVEVGEKVAVWVYSQPKFLGYFDVVEENGIKKIKGLEVAMKKIDVEPGVHNIAIVTKDGESVGYIDVFVEENKIFEDEQAAIESKYTTKEVKEQIEVKFKTETKKDANKKSGSKEVTQKGENGISEITYKIIYDETGKEISKEKIDEKVIKEAIKEIIVVGTADFNTNSAKITSEFTGFMCTNEQIIDYQGFNGCDDSKELPNFKAIVINNTDIYVITLDGASVTPIKIKKDGDLYKGTYKGKTHYFESRSGGPMDEIVLTDELCKQYKLNCGSW